MKTLPKCLSLLLCLATLAAWSLYPALGEADSEMEAPVFEISPEGSDFIFSYQLNEDGAATITSVKWNQMGVAPEDLIVPAEVDEHPVVAIGTNAFNGMGISGDHWDDWDVQLPNWNVLLPETLVRIEEDAFESAMIARVFIPKSVVEMQDNPFALNNRFCDIVVEEGNPVFEMVNGLLMDKRTKTLVASGGKWAGADQIPPGTVAIGPDAFYGCTINSQLDFPETVTTIGRRAFGFCRWDDELEYIVPASVTHIEDWAFCYGYGLTHISLPANVQYMGDNPFIRCQNLESINLHGSGDGLSIVDGALYNQRSKALVVRPAGAESTEFAIQEGTLRIDIGACQDNVQLKTVSIPDSVTVIGVSAFSDCTALESIRIPNGITTIENSAFWRSGLTELALPESVTTIGDDAFWSCKQLTTVHLPAGLKRIGESAFAGCYALTYIPIPQGIEELGDMAFSACYSIEAFQLLGENPRYETVDGILFDKQEKSLLFYPSAKQGTEYTVPPGTLLIGDGAFGYNQNLQQIRLPQGLQEIGISAFSHCVALKEINIPGSVAVVDSAIYFCPKLEKVVLEEGVIEIGRDMFRDCRSLKEDGLVLPSTLKSIRDSALSGCTGLTKIILPEGLESIGNGAFNGCENLKEVNLPISLTFIDMYAFRVDQYLGSNLDITFTAPEGSYAADYLEKMGFAVRKTE